MLVRLLEKLTFSFSFLFQGRVLTGPAGGEQGRARNVVRHQGAEPYQTLKQGILKGEVSLHHWPPV